jgi:uncharacterized protein YdhG (YjbR/CyaY superfamily)
MTHKYASVDAYVETLSDAGKAVAAQIRASIARSVPGVCETIKYNMPAFRHDGRWFLYFAVWKKHVGLYPIYRGNGDFEMLVGPYRAKNDTVQFALDQPFPLAVLEQIVNNQNLSLRT